MVRGALALEIGFFPAALIGLGAGILHAFVVGFARFHPAHIGIHQRSVGRDIADDRIEAFKVATALRHNHAHGLAALEGDQMIGPRHLPVHGEGGLGPVGFDNAFQRRNAVLGHVRGPAHQEVDSRRRAEEERDGEGQDARAEMTVRGIRRGPRQVLHRQAGGALLAAPGGGEFVHRDQQPAGAVGDQQRQAAFGEMRRSRRHPVAPSRGHHQRHLQRRNRIGDERQAAVVAVYEGCLGVCFWRCHGQRLSYPA